MELKLERPIDHMDHICQLAGNARHIAIGSDLDGGFGREQSPLDLHMIADLARFPTCCSAAIAKWTFAACRTGNWLRFLRDAWG